MRRTGRLLGDPTGQQNLQNHKTYNFASNSSWVLHVVISDSALGVQTRREPAIKIPSVRCLVPSRTRLWGGDGVPEFARRFRLSWTRARSHVEQSIKLVQKAQKGIPSDCLSEVRPGALLFREAIAALGKLNSDLEDLEILHSAIIHPTMRKSRERAFLQRDVLMARRVRKFLKHTNYPINRPAAAANQSMFVESVEASIRKFEKKSRIGQMPLTRMDELICRIFKAVAGPKHPMTAANVKTIRIRNKQVKPDTGRGSFRL